MQRYERLWERLLTLLGTLGEVDGSTPGHVLLTVDGRPLELVITEDEWSDLVSIPYGSFSGGAGHLLQGIRRALTDASPYLVYDTYELHPCATPEKPLQAEMEAEHRRVMEHLRHHPDAQVAWRAHPPGEEPS